MWASPTSTPKSWGSMVTESPNKRGATDGLAGEPQEPSPVGPERKTRAKAEAAMGAAGATGVLPSPGILGTCSLWHCVARLTASPRTRH